MIIRTLSSLYFRTPILLRLLITVIGAMIFFGVLIRIIEPAIFPTIFDGIWWAFVTGSTVGYGDYVPLSVAGKLTGILLILAGGGIVTFYMATVSSTTIQHEQDLSEGRVAYKGHDHLILVGWNERTRQLIDMMNQYIHHESIVLVDESLHNVPYRKYHLHFIKGNSCIDDTLGRANATSARSIIITSDPSLSEQQADQMSILTTVAAKGINPNAIIITEILTSAQIKNAYRAGATSVIRSNDFMSSLFFHEVYRKDPAEPFQALVTQLSTQQYLEVIPTEELIGESFQSCLVYFMKTEDLLIGIRQDGYVMINPPAETIVKEEDRLITLSALQQ
ncbi:potassium channel protein [Pontibacillus halophilus JSM 076056 = DSM 19796]|uniref:Potassium channel protein n=1 Tax=Pontibacillus halophilus JSM 076056 = DSM 19796 TaxID=1385510 RepID=A0A0A5GEI9_9BACI|nr:potassium channel family protein [Pontibacillus halophilus]KGX89525.1 potassium channel protein [Pontibacillus halophilus JSM 076056 = DSM 19796]